MKRIAVLMLAGCLLLTTEVSRAELIAYDNLATTANLQFAANDAGRRVPSVDDLQVTAGGLLTQVSFALIADSIDFNPVDVDILLAQDDGNGIPEFFTLGSSDTILMMKNVPGVNGPFGFIPTGDALIVDVDVSAEGVNLTAGSTIWALLAVSRFGFAADVGTVFFGPIANGASDPFVYQVNNDGTIPQVTPPVGDTNAGLGWQLTVVPEPATAMVMLLAGGAMILNRRRRSA